jgi:fumarate hydratase class II
MTDHRIEKDSLGEVEVPLDALYGAQTQRAVNNFRISGIRFPRIFIRALGLIKGCAAEVNLELGLLEKNVAAAIGRAAAEVAEGDWDEQFPLDIFQTGSGTSTNMNANEVIARRAAQILGDGNGAGQVHPNDHVNLGQSSNDVIPAAIHISCYLQVTEVLLPAMSHLEEAMQKRAGELGDVVKTGRTHLMDAMPVTMAQQINGWAFQVGQSRERVESCLPRLAGLALGGTAVGTGINTHPEFGERIADKLSSKTGIPFTETDQHFAAQAGMDTVTELSGHMKTAASALMKISNDMRWMNSGPGAGLGEIVLPELQPGSSIMPGKVNPVICEAMMMVCAQVAGNDVAVSTANSLGNFELNVMLPLIAHNILESITILGNGGRLLADRAIAGFTVNRERIADLLGANPILVTALSPVTGYDRAAEIAKEARSRGGSILEVAAEMTDIPRSELEKLLDPLNLTEGGLEI